MDLDLASLETFVRLAELGSFSETARLQHLSQPAVTMRVAKLESVIGLRLFERHSDGLKLTREGETLLGQARRVLEEHDSLGVKMERFLRESDSRVKVLVDRSIAGDLVTSALAASENDAGTQLVRPDELPGWQDALKRQEVDMVVAGSFLHTSDSPFAQRFDLVRQPGTTLAWNRDYFDIEPGRTTFPEVLRATVLVPAESLVSGYKAFLEKWCMDAYGVLPPDLLEYADESSARDACVAGLGVMIFPGDADQRMSLSSTGLGLMKVFEFLLPDAYAFSIFLRTGERLPHVVKLAMRIGEIVRPGSTQE